MSLKDLGNTLDLNPKLERTLLLEILDDINFIYEIKNTNPPYGNEMVSNILSAEINNSIHGHVQH